jgi:nitric oxide dioxygenase
MNIDSNPAHLISISDPPYPDLHFAGHGLPEKEEAMTLTTAQIELIRDSFIRLQPDVENASELFYRRLFEIAPELRELFNDDMAGQGMRFMSTLGVILDHFDDSEALRPYLERLAQGHAAYGVKPENFHPMGQALIRTMQETLGDNFSKEAAGAWETAYDHLARHMMALAG